MDWPSQDLQKRTVSSKSCQASATRTNRTGRGSPTSRTIPRIWPARRASSSFRPSAEACWTRPSLAFVGLTNDVQRHRSARTLEDDPVLADMRLMWLAAVVEPRSNVQSEGHLTAYAPQHANQPVPGRGNLRTGNRHEVDHFTDTRLGQKTRDEDGGVRIVELLPIEDIDRRSDPEVPALIIVQQRAEDAGRVEARGAEPVDSAVDADECRRLQISNETVIGDEWVRSTSGLNPQRQRCRPCSDSQIARGITRKG